MAKTKYYNKDTQQWEYAETGCIPVRGTHYWVAQDLKPLHDYISSRVMATAEVCFLTISVTSNQSDKSALEGLALSVTFPDGRTAEVEAGSVIAFTEGSVTVQFPEVAGYKRPDNLSVSYAKGSVSETATYLAEEVTVNALVDGVASSEFSYEVSGDGIVCITGSGTSFTGVTKWLVPHGVTITVTPATVDGYTTGTVTHTASGVTGSVSVEWTEIRFGVFIEDTTGKLWDIDSWDGSATFNSVAVINETHSFGIAKEHSSKLRFSGHSDMGTHFCTGYTMNRTSYSISDVYSDYDGEGNTDKIKSYATQNSLAVWAVNYCRDYSFANGKSGYLMAAGEYKMISDNISEVNRALTKVGGTILYIGQSSGGYIGNWTSTLVGDDSVSFPTNGGTNCSCSFNKVPFGESYISIVWEYESGSEYNYGSFADGKIGGIPCGDDSYSSTTNGLSVSVNAGARPLCRLMSNP